MPKYDRELIARMLSCYDGGGYTNEAVAEQIHLLCEAENLEADARTVVREVPDGDHGLAEFTEYFVKNYPGPDTIIYAPEWHAPKIFRAARRAMLSAASGEGVG